ncbi:DUF3987 domain-containing protein [Longitalea luteola]|uniref:DUF3987 domain-containing protein n=1 Tax=Longitalea luteola TaxID=2812563 RepID=UPI001A95B8C2|nr:DUF3987 domain-containing protein [Longitalea luteola]
MKTTFYKKNEFITATNGGIDFYQFVIPDLEFIDEDKCKNTYNPFYGDKNPSLRIYYNNENEKWLFYDYGDTDYKGDVFDFAAYYYDLDVRKDFGRIMQKMASDLKVKLEAEDVPFQQYDYDWEDLLFNYQGEPEDYIAWLMGFEIIYRGSDNGLNDAHRFFSKYGITKDVLSEYNVRSVLSYKWVDQKGNIKHKYYTKGRFVAGYCDANFTKLYSPDPKAFWYVGKKTKNYIFGFDQIERRRRKKQIYRDTLIITGGEKDVLTLSSLGFDAVCFNSETAVVPIVATEVLFHWYKSIVVLYDIDETGKKQAEAIVNKYKGEFNVSAYNLPNELLDLGGKDVSDYLHLGMNVEQLKNGLEHRAHNNCSDMISEPTATDLSDNSPYLPSDIYENLPEFLQILCSQFTDKRDKELILLSALGVTSSLLPTIKGIYDGTKVGCNLYLFVSAPASSGKGVMMWSRALGNKVQRFLKEKYQNDHKRYLADMADYRQNGSCNPDADMPEEPQQKTLFIPANSSVSKITQLMGANNNFGVIFETEGDTLTQAFKNDWGDFSDILRRAFHHETVSMARRGNNEYIEIEKPHLSVVLSGTPNQISSLLESVENGFFSRFVFIDFKAPVVWKDQFGQRNNDIEAFFDKAADYMLELWKDHYGGFDTIIDFTKEQINQLNQYFSAKLQQLYSEHGEHILASVKRTCLVCYRIAMIFSAFRHLETADKLPKNIVVDDKDYRVAVQIVDTLLYHLKTVYSGSSQIVGGLGC